MGRIRSRAPGWRVPLEMINEQRRAWANPNKSALEDDVCWRGWELVEHWSRETFGETVRMALTEGGWTPGALAGNDIRYPKPTPDVVARLTMEALRRLVSPGQISVGAR